MAEMKSRKVGTTRRAVGLDGSVHSVAAVQPPSRTLNIEHRTSNIEGKSDRAVEVLVRRMRRRDVEVGILEELAEDRLMRSDFDGFRLLADRAWRMKVRNIKLGIWMIRARIDAVMGGAA